MQKSHIGLIGLGTMGDALARNIASRGFRVSVWNRTKEKINAFILRNGEGSFYGPKTFEDFIESLEKPRKIIVLVPAEDPTRQVLEQLAPVLDKEDCVMDGANQHFRLTEEFESMLAERGILYLGCGISGGEEGALLGPSMMPGGSEIAWEEFEDILTPAAAEDWKGKACIAYMGERGAGHYVKMVHNGIEYADMQSLAEAYDLLRTLYKLKNQDIADIFKQWNQGRMASFLTEIAIDILEKEEDGAPLLNLILDKAKHKGTGKWTSEEALNLGVPMPSITGALFMRALSSNPKQRRELSPLYETEVQPPNMLVSDFVNHLEKALYASRLAHFEQGFALLREADHEYDYGLNYKEIARIWQGGCIIRCQLLGPIGDYLVDQPVKSFYYADFAQTALNDALKSWRTVVSLATEAGVPLLSINGALSHFETHRHDRLSTNFIQGLRDRFGSHGYERVDKEGVFHTEWTE